jgi:hypothetical protein
VADLAVVGASLPTGRVGIPYSAGVQAVGGAPPYKWTAAGLPPGLSINPASGAISGTPISTGPLCLTVPCPQPASEVYDPTFTVTDSDGVEASAQLPIAIVASSASGPLAPSIPAIHPSITAIRESASRWREGSKLPRISRRKGLGVGTTFSFALNEAASVTFRFYGQVQGRKVGRQCAAETGKNHKRRRCTRDVSAGSLAFHGHTGTNKVVFDGRISRAKKLEPGRYTVTIEATDSAGLHSAAVSLRFTIVK